MLPTYLVVPSGLRKIAAVGTFVQFIIALLAKVALAEVGMEMYIY